MDQNRKAKALLGKDRIQPDKLPWQKPALQEADYEITGGRIGLMADGASGSYRPSN